MSRYDKFKELPNNIEAEQSVIGSILVTNEIIPSDKHYYFILVLILEPIMHQFFLY